MAERKRNWTWRELEEGEARERNPRPTNWTTDYPTQPGFYWIRNYSILGKGETIGRSERTIAYVQKVRDGLSFWLFQWPDIFSRGQVMAAEWQGPIEPSGS